ncbi:MAG: transposase, partial [Opitutales bacterium]|nr:transposase [Opitutales bacterium]
FTDCPAVYHVMSRTVNGEKIFGEKEKAVLAKMLHKVAAFSGVRVLTYCMMANHFHILVEVPSAEGIELTDEELVERYGHLHGENNHLRKTPRSIAYAPNSVEQMQRTLEQGGKEAEELRAALHKRMHNLPEFVKTFKQRVSIWYNSEYRRYGPLWSEKFKSVLVEGRANALKVVAAYIDLNPVRAGLVDDPGKYAYSGYGESVMEGEPKTELGYIVNAIDKDTGSDVLRFYRMLVLGQGRMPREGKVHLDDQAAHEEITRLLSEQAKSDSERRGRERTFAAITKGQVVGSESFVGGLLKEAKQCLSRKVRRPSLIFETPLTGLFSPNFFRFNKTKPSKPK